MPGRFLASTFLGFVLGWVRMRTASVLPCMLLHALHNGLLLSVLYYGEELVARGWHIEEQSHLPASWLAASAVLVALTAGMLVAATRKTRLAA